MQNNKLVHFFSPQCLSTINDSQIFAKSNLSSRSEGASTILTVFSDSFISMLKRWILGNFLPFGSFELPKGVNLCHAIKIKLSIGNTLDNNVSQYNYIICSSTEFMALFHVWRQQIVLKLIYCNFCPSDKITVSNNRPVITNFPPKLLSWTQFHKKLRAANNGCLWNTQRSSLQGLCHIAATCI